MIVSMYNPCSSCGGVDLRLVDDTQNMLSQRGGIRLVCLSCSRNTVPGVWNEYNVVDEELDDV